MDIEEAMILISIDTQRLIIHPWSDVWKRLDKINGKPSLNIEWARREKWEETIDKIPKDAMLMAYRTLREWMIEKDPSLKKELGV